MSTAVGTAAAVMVSTWSRATREVLVTTGRAAKLLGLSRQRIHQLIQEGKIEGAEQRPGGGWWKVPLAWVQAQRPAVIRRRGDDQTRIRSGHGHPKKPTKTADR